MQASDQLTLDHACVNDIEDQFMLYVIAKIIIIMCTCMQVPHQPLAMWLQPY